MAPFALHEVRVFAYYSGSSTTNWEIISFQDWLYEREDYDTG